MDMWQCLAQPSIEPQLYQRDGSFYDVAERLGPYIWAHSYLWVNKHMNCSVSSAIREMQIKNPFVGLGRWLSLHKM